MSGRRYVVIGAGAVGVGLAAGFAEAGIPVVLVSRGRTFDAIRANGLIFDHDGRRRALGVSVAGTPGDVDLRPSDVLVLAVKSQDAPAALADWAWRPVAGGGVAAQLPIVLTQNGLDAERAAARYFETVVGGVALIAGRHVVPGEVEVLNAPAIGTLVVGGYPSAALAPHASVIAGSVAQDLQQANWLSQVVPQIGRWLTWKLTVNATFALSVLAGTDDERAALRGHVVAEVREVLAAAGQDVADPDTERTYDHTRSVFPTVNGRSAHQPSTWQSFARGAGSEVDFLNGEVVLLGRLHGVPTPYNTAVQRLLGRSAALGEGPGVHTVAEVVALAEAADAVAVG